MSEVYKGSCQCGNIRFYFSTDLAPEHWRVRTCTCSFCQSHPTHVHASDANGTVRFEYANRGEVIRHRFATNTADFLICANCQCYLGAITPATSGAHAVVNVDHLVDDVVLPHASPLSFDGESLDERLARRGAGWTP
ncbi:MAG: hypothetical protein K0U93_25120, partial [Gammaproteobacteria bacterium]|nr:hypothetical protein [Gammaproteobacteria bacterium]